MDDMGNERGETEVVELSREALLQQVREACGEAGLPVDRFIELGRSDELRDEDLRDLWLAAGPLLVD